MFILTHVNIGFILLFTSSPTQCLLSMTIKRSIIPTFRWMLNPHHHLVKCLDSTRDESRSVRVRYSPVPSCIGSEKCLPIFDCSSGLNRPTWHDRLLGQPGWFWFTSVCKIKISNTNLMWDFKSRIWTLIWESAGDKWKRVEDKACSAHAFILP